MLKKTDLKELDDDPNPFHYRLDWSNTNFNINALRKLYCARTFILFAVRHIQIHSFTHFSLYW